MEKGQRVKWKNDGSLGTVNWVTTKGSFAVDWDNGDYVEYTSDLQDLVLIIM